MNAATVTGNLFERLKAWRRSRAMDGSNGGSNSGKSSSNALPVRDHIDIPGVRAVRLLAFDQPLVAVIGVLLALGLVMVFSTTIAMSEVVQIKRVLADGTVIKEYVEQTYWVKRHVQALVIAFVAALITLRIPTTVWEKYAPLVFIAALVLLVVVLIHGIGIVANKSRRWLPLGLMQFQPGELAKLAIAMYAANYMLRRMDKREQFFKAVMPMVLAVAVAGGLLLRQPDMGTFIVIATIAMGVLFLGGVNARMFFLIAAVIVATFALLIAFDDLRRERIFAFLDPWNPKYVQGKAYQLTHSLIALGRGEWFGNGLGSSVEKLHYLPEAHTDFMLAVIGEELGLAGVASVIVLFFWLVRRIFVIGRQAVALDRVYAGLMVQGIGIWMAAQGFINMGVNLGVLPTKGLTLPLMSYGGSAILVTLIALAMVVRVDVENRALMRGGRS